MMNKVIVAGRLVRDCEMKYIQNGQALTKFTIAVQEDYKGKDGKYGVNYIDVVCWGKLGEFVGEYCGEKGLRVIVEGMLKQNVWKDQHTGKTMSKIHINAGRVKPIDWAGSRQENSQSNYNNEERFSTDSSDFMDGDTPF